MDDDAYDVALLAVDHECVPTCIPVYDNVGDEAVAVVTLKPNRIASVGLTHEYAAIRARAHIAAARQSHELMRPKGFTFRCR